MTSNTKPVDEVRIGKVKATIWRNQTDNGSRYNVTFGRIYKDDQGEWNTTHSFGRHDLLVLAKVADMAHTNIVRFQAESRHEKAAGKQDEEQQQS